jgi:CRISPR system Cascade subunit CasE
MFLSRIYLDLRCREARRDLSDPYQLHSTLCRAFSPSEKKCPEGEFLWRLEPEVGPSGPAVLVQSRGKPDWAAVGVSGWLAKVDRALDLTERLKLDLIDIGQRFRFRLRANPCVKRNGKRLGLLHLEEQEAWIERQALQHGFMLPGPAFGKSAESARQNVAVRISHEQMLKGKRRSGDEIRVYSVIYDGFLKVTETRKFVESLQTGIGHGKTMGLGLLSVAPG